MTNTVTHPVEPGGLGAEHHERIFELAEQGWGFARIARGIRKHPSTVQWFMYSRGLTAPRQSEEQPATYMRGGRPVRRFSADEDRMIEQLGINGLKPKAIAEKISARFGHPRTEHTVRCRLIMLAAIEEPAHA